VWNIEYFVFQSYHDASSAHMILGAVLHPTHIIFMTVHAQHNSLFYATYSKMCCLQNLTSIDMHLFWIGELIFVTD
jgi:hypothetical protein